MRCLIIEGGVHFLEFCLIDEHLQELALESGIQGLDGRVSYFFCMGLDRFGHISSSGLEDFWIYYRYKRDVAVTRKIFP